MIVLRVVACALVALATYFFVVWTVFAFVAGPAIPMTVSLACAVGTAWLVWSVTRPGSITLARSVVLGAAGLGTAGFLGGFFGPMILAPGANQGPLLGLLITGPLGCVIGGIGGLFYWLAARRGRDAAPNQRFISP
jgi:hypothetical protein